MKNPTLILKIPTFIWKIQYSYTEQNSDIFRILYRNALKRNLTLVEISVELNMKNKFSYLLTCVDHFSKYALAILIRNKESITVRNAIAQVFILGYPELI